MLSHFIIMLVLNEIHTANIIHGYSSELRFYNFVERKKAADAALGRFIYRFPCY